jgi:hypothetical protein
VSGVYYLRFHGRNAARVVAKPQEGRRRAVRLPRPRGTRALAAESQTHAVREEICPLPQQPSPPAVAMRLLKKLGDHREEYPEALLERCPGARGLEASGVRRPGSTGHGALKP